MYRNQHGDFPAGVSEADYRRRMEAQSSAATDGYTGVERRDRADQGGVAAKRAIAGSS